MKMLFFQLSVILGLAALCNATIIESGDAGASFAANTSLAKCNEANVAGVYMCTGNVVNVVSSLPGAGSTFYKPDGRVISCPVVAPSQRTGECVQLTSPNICGNVSVCKAQAPETNASQPEPQPAPQPQPPKQNTTIQPSQPQPSAPAGNRTTIVTQKKIEAPAGSDLLVLGILVVGMIGLGILHYMYTKRGGQQPL
jgi:hypothetical protein